MKINDPNNTSVGGVGGTQNAAATHPHRSRGGAGRKNDEIQISSLSQALAALQTNSPQREARVGQLSSEVHGGSYIIDYHAVSGSLIQETLAASAT